MKGGYILIDCTGLDLSVGTAQEVAGSWKNAQNALNSDKPIIAVGATYGSASVTPVTCFAWRISETEIVIVGATLHCHVKSDNTVTVLDVAGN